MELASSDPVDPEVIQQCDNFFPGHPMNYMDGNSNLIAISPVSHKKLNNSNGYYY